MRGRRTSAIVAAVLLLSGCSAVNEATFDPTDEVSSDRTAELNRGLRSMPSLEVTLEEYRELRRRLAREIEAIAPGVRFVPKADPADRFPDDRGLCSGEWLRTDGETVYLDNWTSAVPIDDEAWPAASDLVRAASGKLGVGHESSLKSSPGNREVRFTNSQNASVELLSWKAAVISIRTPCRLADGPAVPTPPGADEGASSAGEG